MSTKKTIQMSPYAVIHEDAIIRVRNVTDGPAPIMMEFRTADFYGVVDLYLDPKAARKLQQLLGDALIMHASKAVDRALDELEAEARS